jgi:hypothetical protein
VISSAQCENGLGMVPGIISGLDFLRIRCRWD